MTRRCIHDIGCILFWIRSENVIIPSFLWIFRISVKSIFLLTLPSHFSILAQEDIYASCCPWPEIDRNFIFVFNEIFKNAGKNFNKCYKSHFGNNHYDNFLISSRLISSPLHAFQIPSWFWSKKSEQNPIWLCLQYHYTISTISLGVGIYTITRMNDRLMYSERVLYY